MRTRFLSLFAAVLIVAGMLLPRTSQAAVVCTFDRDLQIGSVGEDVRCLQKYLNAEGFIIATDGVGSPGNETNLFRDKTVAAVKKWQASKGISPATGGWGPLSRALYAKLVVPTTPATPPVATPTPTTKPTQSTEEKSARTKLLAAVNAIKAARAEYDSAIRHQDRTGHGQEFIDDAEAALLRALSAFLSSSFSDAADYATTARSKAGDAADEIDGDVSKNDLEDEAKDALKEAEDDLGDARDDVGRADDHGKDINEADDLLDKAKRRLNDAKESFDEGDYSDVMDFVDDIEGLIKDALDSID
jgi:hypothetical protein